MQRLAGRRSLPPPTSAPARFGRGGLRPERQRRLRQFAQQLNGSQEVRIRPRPELKPGTRLVREWQGRTYDVRVLDDGFSWQGTSYRSLSALAGKITGTAWSGPLFFGLKPNRSATRRSSRVPGPAGAPTVARNAAGGGEPQTLRDLHPQILRGRARAGIQFARGAARRLRGLHSQPAARGLAVGEKPLRRWRVLGRQSRATRGATPAHRYPGGPDRYRGRVQGRPADPLARRFCPAGRALRRTGCVVRFGDAAIQHDELDGAPDAQCAVVLCPVRAGGHR